MYESQAPGGDDLPSSRQLAKATGFAFVAAAAILTTIVLPAEYGLDPLGTGRFLGLASMGEMKRESTATSISVQSPASPDNATTSRTSRSESITVTLGVGEGMEVKATMNAGDALDYRWTAQPPGVKFDMHGEKKNASFNDFTSYKKGSAVADTGILTAPFEGTHGWYWENESAAPIAIKLEVNGKYESLSEM